MRKIIISLTFVALVGLVGYLTLTSNQSVALKVHNTNEDLSQFVNEFKNIDEIGSCMSKVDEKVDEFLQKADKATRKQFHKEHNQFFRWLHKYVNDHQGEAPSAEEVQAQVEKIGGLKGPVAPIWQAEIDQYTECSAAAFDVEYVNEFKNINEIGQCMDKVNDQMKAFLKEADKATRKQFIKEHDQFFRWLHKFVDDHQGEAPSVDEVKAQIESIGGFKGPIAQIWQVEVDQYTECSAALVIDFITEFKNIRDVGKCMGKIDKIVNDYLKKADNATRKAFHQEHQKFFEWLHQYVDEHKGEAPSVEEVQAEVEQLGGLKGANAQMWEAEIKQYSECTAAIISEAVMSEFKNIREVGQCMGKLNQVVNDYLKKADAATRKAFQTEHHEFFQWLHQYVDEHKGEAPSVEEVQAEVEKLGGFKGANAQMWETEIKQYTECTATLISEAVMSEFKNIREVGQCMGKLNQVVNDYLKKADAATRKAFQTEHHEFFEWLHQYVNEHKGEAPTVEEVQAEVEKLGGFKGANAQMWETEIKQYTECTAAI